MICDPVALELGSELLFPLRWGMQTLIIEVSGGVVQEIYSDVADLRVVKIDWDAGDSPGDACSVGKLLVQPISAVPDITRGAFLTLHC